MLDLDRTSDRVPPGLSKLVHLLHQLDEAGEPITLSINGKSELAIADDRSFRMLVDLINHLELLEALKKGSNELDEGKGLSLDEVKEQARVKYGLSL